MIIQNTYDSEALSIKGAAALLEKHSTQVSQLFKEGRIKTYKDANGNVLTREADLIHYLTDQLPSRYKATPVKDGESLPMR